MSKTKAELTQQVKFLTDQVSKLQEAATTHQQQMLDLRQELTTTKRNYDGMREVYKRKEHEFIHEQCRNKDRIKALELLLVHNGKAIGALTELAAEKFKSDDLPF